MKNKIMQNKKQKQKATGHFLYFLKVVPTTITSLNGTNVFTNQFSVTEQMKEVDMLSRLGAQKIPGVFFIYDVAPFMVEISEYKQSFTKFLVNVCALIGKFE